MRRSIRSRRHSGVSRATGRCGPAGRAGRPARCAEFPAVGDRPFYPTGHVRFGHATRRSALSPYAACLAREFTSRSGGMMTDQTAYPAVGTAAPVASTGGLAGGAVTGERREPSVFALPQQRSCPRRQNPGPADGKPTAERGAGIGPSTAAGAAAIPRPAATFSDQIPRAETAADGCAQPSAAGRAPLLVLRVYSVISRHVDGAVTGRPADDDLPQRDVIREVRLVQHVLGIGDDLDVVDAIGQVGDVEGLARHALEVRVAPAKRHHLLHPQRTRCAALAGESGVGRLPVGVRNQQVHRVGGSDAEADLVAAHDGLLVLSQQPVLSELLEMPVMMTVLVVDAHGAGPGPANEVAAAPEVLVSRHDGGVRGVEALDVERAVAKHGYRGAERDM